MAENKTMSETKAINFMGVRQYAGIMSVILMLISIAALAVRGINFGLDFTGGTLVELSYSQAVPVEQVRHSLHAAGYERATVVNLGSTTDFAIRLAAGEDRNIGHVLVDALQKDSSGRIELRRVDFVGPQVGDDLRERGSIAVLLSFLAVGGVIAMRYQYKFSFGAVVGLVHDVVIVLGCFALFQWEFDLSVLAAVLAVIGSTVNDTIVVYDRIREVFRKLRKADTAEVINISLTQTLDRTIGTKVTVLLTLVSLLVFGGDMIRGFAIALAIGTFFGMYSSTYVAASFLMLMKTTSQDLVVAEKNRKQLEEGVV